MLIIYLSLISLVSSWGGDGHRIITQIALNRISERAKAFLDSFLDSTKGIINASIWADTEAAERAYPGSSAYHFCNTPYRQCSAFRIDRDCGNYNDNVCIVTALADAIETLVDIEAAKPKRTDALKFILHLMADIHQPMHVGFRHDFGGNSIILDEPEGFNLHTIWDTWLVEKYAKSIKASSWKSVADYFSAVASHGAGAGSAGHSMSIFEDRDSLITYASNLATHTATLSTCAEGYTDHNGAYIRGRGHAINERLYLARKLPIVEQQLSRAGSQLAQLIETITAEVHSRHGTAKADRREARIAALFGNLMNQTTRAESQRKSYLETGFCVLPIEFGPETEDMVTSVVTTTRIPAAGRGGRKQTKNRAGKGAGVSAREEEVDIDALVSEFGELDAATKNYELINGIDLTRIRSVPHISPDGSQYRLVTDAANIERNPEYSTNSAYSYRTFLPTNGSYELVTFLFDSSFFLGKGKVFDDEVRIRTLLKLANKDCTIDISEYLLNINKTSSTTGIRALAPVREAGEAGISYELIPELKAERASRIARLAERSRRSSVIAERYRPFQWAFQNARLEKRSTAFVYGDVIAIFTHKTLRSAGDRMRVNFVCQMRTAPEGPREIVYLIDIDIYEGCRCSKELHEILLDAYEMTHEMDLSHFEIRPSLKQELIALNYIITTKDDPEVVLSHPDRAIISKYVLYSDEDSVQKFHGAEWQRAAIHTE